MEEDIRISEEEIFDMKMEEDIMGLMDILLEEVTEVEVEEDSEEDIRMEVLPMEDTEVNPIHLLLVHIMVDQMEVLLLGNLHILLNHHHHQQMVTICILRLPHGIHHLHPHRLCQMEPHPMVPPHQLIREVMIYHQEVLLMIKTRDQEVIQIIEDQEVLRLTDRQDHHLMARHHPALVDMARHHMEVLMEDQAMDRDLLTMDQEVHHMDLEGLLLTMDQEVHHMDQEVHHMDQEDLLLTTDQEDLRLMDQADLQDLNIRRLMEVQVLLPRSN